MPSPRLLATLTVAVVALPLASCSRDHQDIRTQDTGASVSPTPDDHGIAVATATQKPKPRPRTTTRPPSPTASATPGSTSSPVSARPTVRARHARYVFPVQGCRVDYGHSHHDYPATDIFAARGCTVVSPVTGVIDEVSTVDRWSSSVNSGATRGGISFSVVGVDGVRYYGSHLTTLLVSPGQHVRAGEKVGTVGNTGSARGIAPHLHFGLSWPTRHGIWWVRRGMVYPWRYLDSWRAGASRSPAPEVEALHRQRGDVPPCSVDC